MAWSEEMQDGFTFAALLAGRVSSTEDDAAPGPEAFVSRGAQGPLGDRLAKVRAGHLGAKDLIPALRPRPHPAILRDPSGRVRAVTGALLTPAERRSLPNLADLPRPRRGFEVSPGLAKALGRWASHSLVAEQQATETREWEEEEAAWSES